MSVVLILIVLLVPSILLILDLISVAFNHKRLFNKIVLFIFDILCIVILPTIYLIVFDESTNDCCSDSATFSPQHKITIYAIIFVCIIGYFISAYKKKNYSPLVEVGINSTLLFGLLFNMVICYHINFYAIFGNISIIILFLIQLIQNHKKFLKNITELDYQNNWEKLAWKILHLNPLIKYPILLIAFAPIFTVITSLLLLFGQKPDSLIRAFTDTYKHGFSQLDYMCKNVECGGHFLCSVAAKGHKSIVTPVRYGERGGNKIICNRQLLISNAFEEIIEQKFPKLHHVIRTRYNKVGNFIHKYYTIFNNKIVADIIYILMKPFEWFFLFVIYLLDEKPENRIAQQYLSKKERRLIFENYKK